MDTYLQFVRAAEAKDEAVITRIIHEHPDLHNFVGDDGSLLDVLRYNCPELFAAAFVAGLSPDSGSSAPLQTFLQHAVSESDIELVKLCLRHGADVERRNNDGETALGYAASYGSLETVRLLVESGAHVNAVEGTQQSHYSTALDSACSSDPATDRPAIRDYLREHGAKRYSELPPSHSA
jgi:ankyrin repeat protein